MAEDKYIQVSVDSLVAMASPHVVRGIIVSEVQRAIETDADLRILIREMVKEAFGKINLLEIIEPAVQKAVENAIKEDRP